MSGSQSTSTGTQPARSTASAQEMMVKLGMMTSAPAGSCSASMASWSAAVPLHSDTPCRTPQYSAQLRSNSRNESAFRRDPGGIERLHDIGARLRVEQRLGDRNHDRTRLHDRSSVPLVTRAIAPAIPENWVLSMSPA